MTGSKALRQAEAFICTEYFGLLTTDYYCVQHRRVLLHMTTRRWQLREGESSPFRQMACFHDQGDQRGMLECLPHLHKYDLRCANDMACWDRSCKTYAKRKSYD